MTRKLMLWLTGATILFWIAAAWVGSLVIREEFDEVFDSALQETAQRLMPLIVNDLFQRDSPNAPPSVAGSNAGEEEYLTYQVRDAEGRILMRSHDAQQEAFDAPLKPGFYDTAESRIYTEVAVSGTVFLQVLDQLDHRDEAVAEAAASLLLPLLALAPLSMLAIWILVRSLLRPISHLSSEIGSRDGSNLSPLTISDMPRELETINVSVNRLLERLRTALEAERTFASNSAHELRTPIAGALAQTQRLLAELPDGPLKLRALQIEATLTALARLSEKLLQLARAESGIGLTVEPTDIVAILALVIEDFERKPEYAKRLRQSGLADATPVMRRVDVDALGIVFRNLIENALIHGDDEETVEITVRDDGAVCIVNGGPVVPSETLRNLSQRFRRGQSSGKGSGLGLAISEMLLRQMGGRLRLASPASQREDGFQAVVELRQ
jgi:two-component system OmpR family sensor kinase